MEREKPLIVAVCEMEPKNSKQCEMLDYTNSDYSIHPVNLDPNNSSRGIAVYTHNSIEKSAIQIKPKLWFEVCILEIKLHSGDIMIFGCFYRSPTPSEKSEENNDNLNNLLRCISKKKYSHMCVHGDFNYRDINWSACVTPHNEDSKEAKFIETTTDCFLRQHIIEPTRRRGNDEASMIDLVLTDEVMQVSDITNHAPLGKSDHSVITFKFHCYLDYTKPKERYSYEKADYQRKRNDLTETNWANEFLMSGCGNSVGDLWDSFKSKIYKLRNKFVPKTTVTGKPSCNKKGSIPVGKQVAILQQKEACHRRWMSAKKRTNAQTARLEYTKACDKVKCLMHQAKKKEYA